MDASFLDQVKYQAQVLVPILKTFQEELGKEKVDEIVKKAIGPMYKQFGSDWWANTPGEPWEKIKAAMDMFAIGEAIRVEEPKVTEDEYHVDIYDCQYAKFYRDELGEAELGDLLVCGVDEPMTEGYGADITLDRPKTIMMGGDRCEFRYKLNK